MILAFEEIIKNSFVVTIDNKRFNAFKDAFLSAGFSEKLLPKKFIGYEISNEYLINTFKPIFDLQFSKVRGYLEQEFEKFHCIFNSASHCAIVQHAMLLDLPFVTIFEDDAVPMNGILKKLPQYLSNIPDDCDILKLGFTRPMDYKEQTKSISNSFYVRKTLGAHSYIVFQKYYDCLLRTNYSDPTPDESKLNNTSAKIYNSTEPLFIQINENSDTAVHGSRNAQYYNKYANGLIDINNYGF